MKNKITLIMIKNNFAKNCFVYFLNLSQIITVKLDFRFLIGITNYSLFQKLNKIIYKKFKIKIRGSK